jgi:hypothetical protein
LLKVDEKKNKKKKRMKERCAPLDDPGAVGFVVWYGLRGGQDAGVTIEQPRNFEKHRQKERVDRHREGGAQQTQAENRAREPRVMQPTGRQENSEGKRSTEESMNSKKKGFKCFLFITLDPSSSSLAAAVVHTHTIILLVTIISSPHRHHHCTPARPPPSPALAPAAAAP